MDREQWRPFLKRWSEEWIAAHDPVADQPLDESVVRDGRLGFAPASADGIAAAEARRGEPWAAPAGVPWHRPGQVISCMRAGSAEPRQRVCHVYCAGVWEVSGGEWSGTPSFRRLRIRRLTGHGGQPRDGQPPGKVPCALEPLADVQLHVMPAMCPGSHSEARRRSRVAKGDK